MSEMGPGENPVAKPQKKTLRGHIMFVTRLAVSIGLMVAIVLIYIPEESRPRIITAYGDANIWWLLLAVLFTFTDRIVSGWKWLLLLREREPDLPAWPVMKVFFVSTFFGYFLPSSIGGDAVRVVSLNRIKGDLAGSTSSVVIDRAYGTLGLLLVSAIAIIPAVGQAIPTQGAILLWLITSGALVGVLLLSSRTINRWLVNVFKLQDGKGIRQRIHKLLDAFISFLHAKLSLLRIFFLSLMVQLLRVLIVVSFSLSLGLDVNPLVHFIYVPIITVITFLPFSIAGIGVREALFVLFYSMPEIGLAKESALSLSLLFFSSGIIATLPGLVIYLITGIGKRFRKS